MVRQLRDAGGASASAGSSLLPTMVMFRPICTATGVPSTSMLTLPLRYQPNEPVEKCLTSADSDWPAMLTIIGFALLRKSARLIGQAVFLAIGVLPPWRSWETATRRTARQNRIIPPYGKPASVIIKAGKHLPESRRESYIIHRTAYRQGENSRFTSRSRIGHNDGLSEMRGTDGRRHRHVVDHAELLLFLFAIGMGVGLFFAD